MQTIEHEHVCQVCRNLFYGHYSVFVAGLGKQQAIWQTKVDMTGWDENWMWMIKCCADVGFMHDPEDQVHVIF